MDLFFPIFPNPCYMDCYFRGKKKVGGELYSVVFIRKLNCCVLIYLDSYVNIAEVNMKLTHSGSGFGFWKLFSLVFPTVVTKECGILRDVTWSDGTEC